MKNDTSIYYAKTRARTKLSGKMHFSLIVATLSVYLVFVVVHLIKPFFSIIRLSLSNIAMAVEYWPDLLHTMCGIVTEYLLRYSPVLLLYPLLLLYFRHRAKKEKAKRLDDTTNRISIRDIIKD